MTLFFFRKTCDKTTSSKTLFMQGILRVFNVTGILFYVTWYFILNVIFLFILILNCFVFCVVLFYTDISFYAVFKFL